MAAAILETRWPMFARVSATISTERFVGERRHYRMSTRPS
jgi:hypothetical protein